MVIAPLLPYAIKGAIWYQGEANACIFQTVGHNTAQNAVFLNTFNGRFRILHHITAATVQQPVIPPRRPMRQIPLLHQHRLKATQRQISHNPCASCAAAMWQSMFLPPSCRKIGRI